ncbi:MAG: cyclic nucleotide-binding domain-containing protein [Actinobacteria bacterium]|nr:cyclic nucleotide-binding domain-containing protein [Actinomycetota bacterium]
MSESTVDSLARLALFADLSRPQVEEVSHLFDEQVFAEGERVLRHGLSGSSFYVVLEGEASVRIDGDERMQLGRGDFFGEISALTGDPPSADVVATSLLRCLVIAATQLEEFLVEHPRVMLRMLQAEARRLQTAGQWQQ